ncbi:MAG: hypothetical protein FRX49_03991 [Trebouxia sp. A1-2]|nr:MAG: hypothetical protein FRX49_03991 [Trebouxia sp. A1-2]
MCSLEEGGSYLASCRPSLTSHTKTVQHDLQSLKEDEKAPYQVLFKLNNTWYGTFSSSSTAGESTPGAGSFICNKKRAAVTPWAQYDPFPIIPLAPDSTAKAPLVPGAITYADEHIASVIVLVHNLSDKHVVEARATWYKFSIVTGDAQSNNERVVFVCRVLDTFNDYKGMVSRQAAARELCARHRCKSMVAPNNRQ